MTVSYPGRPQRVEEKMRKNPARPTEVHFIYDNDSLEPFNFAGQAGPGIWVGRTGDGVDHVYILTPGNRP